MKKLIALLLILAMLAGLGTTALAAEDKPLAGKIAVLSTGDIAGNIDLYPWIKAAKDYYEAQGAQVILVDCGNFLRGSVWANFDRGASVYALMDAVGYDVARLAPEDFTYTDATTGYPYHGNFNRYYTQAMLQDGTTEISYFHDNKQASPATLPAREPAKFQTLSSEFTPLKEGIYSFQPWTDVVTADGRRVRFETFDIDWASPSFVDPDTPIVPRPVDFLQDGFLAYGRMEAPAPTEAAAYQFSILNETPVESGDYGGVMLFSEMFTDCCGIRIENEDGSFEMADVDLSAFEPDPEVAALVETVKTRAAASSDAKLMFQNEVCLEGRDSVSRNMETNFGDLVTDALVWYAQNYIDGYDKTLPTVAVQNGGNLDDFLYAGPVTQVDLLRALPFSPMGVSVLTLSGAQLLEALEAACQTEGCPGFAHVSGLEYSIDLDAEYDAGAAYGKFFKANSISRVSIQTVNGQPFDPAASYNVVCDNFLLRGASGQGGDTYYVFSDAKAAGAPCVDNGNGVKTRDMVAMYVNQVLDGSVGQDYQEAQGRITLKKLVPAWETFRDVPEGEYYSDPVGWAVKEGVVKGVAPGLFAPDRNCSRAEVVTMLWRAAGCQKPAVTQNPFTDAEEGSYYYEAMLWALEQGITTGTSDTTFEPNTVCTRAQIVTFLYRAAGQPPVSEEEPPFLDVEAGTYYSDAVLWAVGEKITLGTGEGRFSPDKTCTRAEVVTFLYRSAQ